MPPATDEISPMALAAELGVRPQQIYGLVRKGRVDNWRNDKGKVVVSRKEVEKALSSPAKRGPKTDKVTAHDVEGVASPVTVGDIVTWRTPQGTRVTQVRSKEEPFNFMADLWGKQVFFRNHSLRKRLDEGTAKIERPRELLEMVAWQFAQQGQDALASSLLSWIATHETELDDGRTDGDVVRPAGEEADVAV